LVVHEDVDNYLASATSAEIGWQ